jgi:hypothetical protein
LSACALFEAQELAEKRQHTGRNPRRDPVVVIPPIRLELVRNAGFDQRCVYGDRTDAAEL